MNKIENLIKQRCPKGVEFKTLGELGVFENTGVDKKIVDGQKFVMLLNFMDIMRNKHVTKDLLSMEVTASGSKIEKCDIKKYDVFITPSSETRDEIGFTAVADEDIPNAVYSYHIMRYRLFEKNDVTPYFISYLFESNDLRSQIFKASKGLTRFGLSAKDFAKLQIPLPPLAIQREIVNTLDKFTELEAELELELAAELKARKKQYEYYRCKLLTFNKIMGGGGKWLTLKEICKNIISGKNINRKENGIYPVYGSTGIIAYTDEYVYEKEYILVARVGANAGYVHIGNGKYDVSDNTLIIQNQEDDIKLKFLYYLLVNMNLNQYAKGGGQPLITAGQLKSFKIPIPPLAEQNCIVAILDKFDALVSDISAGLPAEIKMRRQQYAYYRNKLLTFKEYE